METPLDISDVLRLLRGNNVPALVRALRVDLGHTRENAAQIFGWTPTSTWGSLVADVEDGLPPPRPFDAGYVVRGILAVWLIRCGGWRHLPGGGGWKHTGGAHISGNALRSWASVPGRKHIIEESIGDWGCEGPVLRHDILRLMLRIHQEQEGCPADSRPLPAAATRSPTAP